MKRVLGVVLMLAMLACLAVVLVGCSEEIDPPLGQWREIEPGEESIWEFRADGTGVVLPDNYFTWSVRGDRLTMVWTGEGGGTVEHDFSIEGNRLTFVSRTTRFRRRFERVA